MKKHLLVIAALSFFLFSCSHDPTLRNIDVGGAEKHFKTLAQLTFDGTHAEAYFSPDSKKLIFQGHSGDQRCDQIFTMNIDGTAKKRVSREGGRNTCSYFIDNETLLFSSTMKESSACPKERDKSKGYVWEIFKSYDIYKTDLTGAVKGYLSPFPSYDAEATVCGKKIAFTSARGDASLAIYTMDTDGKQVKKLTDRVGYSGGPFFSPDCSKIVYRAYYPTTDKEKIAFSKAVNEGYIPPGPLEIWVMNADGSNKHQITNYNAASFAPSFYPNGKKVIFSSNTKTNSEATKDSSSSHGREFQLFGLPVHSKNKKAAEQITSSGTFNGFPMFSPDGKYLVFASNRNSGDPKKLQIFLAEWQD